MPEPPCSSAMARRCCSDRDLSRPADLLQPRQLHLPCPLGEVDLDGAPEVWESVIGQCAFDRNNNLAGITLHPVIIGGDAALQDGVLVRRLAPHLATGTGAERILRRLSEQSARLGVEIHISNGVGLVTI